MPQPQHPAESPEPEQDKPEMATVLRLDPPNDLRRSEDGSLELRAVDGAVQLLMAPPYLSAPHGWDALAQSTEILQRLMRMVEWEDWAEGDVVRTEATRTVQSCRSLLNAEQHTTPSRYVPVTLDDGVAAAVRGAPTLHWPTDEEMANAIRASSCPSEDVVLVMELPGPGQVPEFHTIRGGDRERIHDAHGIPLE